MANETMAFCVTREQLEQARARLAAAGLELAGDAGNVEVQGFGVAYAYAEGRLSLTLTKKPAFVPAFVIRQRVRERLRAEGIHEV